MDSTAVVVFDRIESAVTRLGEALQVPAEQVWEILVRQQYVEGVKTLLVGLVLAFVACKMLTFSADVAHKDRRSNDEEAAAGVSAFLGFIAAIFAVLFLVDAPGYLINSEYYALKSLSSMIK